MPHHPPLADERVSCDQGYAPEIALRIGIDPGVRPAAGVGGISPGQADGAAGPVRVLQQRPGGVAVLDRGGDDPITPGHPGRAAAGISVQLC
jgi:hypothetical protein